MQGKEKESFSKLSQSKLSTRKGKGGTMKEIYIVAWKECKCSLIFNLEKELKK